MRANLRTVGITVMADQWLPGGWGLGEESTSKECKEISESKKCYFDCGDGFTGAYTYRNTSD